MTERLGYFLFSSLLVAAALHVIPPFYMTKDQAAKVFLQIFTDPLRNFDSLFEHLKAVIL